MRKLLSSTLRHRLAIEAPVLTPDEQGGYTKEWKCFETVWAKVEPVSGRESLINKKLTEQSSYRVIMRHRTDITHDMRLVYENQTLNIRSIQDPEGKRQLLEIIAEAGE